jgi:hypothetical protein
MTTTWVRFDADGPYSFRSAVGSNNRISSKSLKAWFTQHAHEVGAHKGVYIIASGQKRPKPWYVGLAAKQTFRAECCTPDKVGKINKALAAVGKGAPVLLFLQVTSKRGTLAAPVRKAVHMLETEMIQWCLSRNAKLLNIRKVAPRLAPYVHGVLRSGPGKPHGSAVTVRKMLGL